MRESNRSTIRIDRLRLRIPGETREDGRDVASAVSQLLANGLSPTRDRRVGGVRVRLSLDRPTAADGTAGAIADAVLSRLTRRRDA